MSKDGFVHLHVHSHYSLLDGGTNVTQLANKAAELGMPAMALTDHGNMFGAIDFYNAAKKAEIKPILGIEAYISPTTRFDKSMRNQREACYHLVLLAMNETGWMNLKKLSSRAYMEGFYYRPRVDRELLAEFQEGVICTTACLGGEVPAALMMDDYDKAFRIAGEYRDIFGPERFFLEVQSQGIDKQTQVNPGLVKIAEQIGCGVVGTNDVHFLTREDKPSHEVLCCVSMARTLEEYHAEVRANPDREAYPPTLYLRSPAEMREAFKAFPGAADNTLKIAEMCNVNLDFSKEFLPVFTVPEGKTDDEYLADLAWAGLAERFDGGEIPDDYRARLDRELGVIKDKGYSSYFLIVNDFVEYGRNNDIPSAPRGSGVSTLLGYALKIAEVDPLKYGLLFERFTDPQREEAPDIDIDICQEGRGKIIQYVREKYGQVAQIITYGTLKARAVLRDVGRVLDIPLNEVDAICKLVPGELKMTLEKALDAVPELKNLYDTDPRIRAMIDHGKRLEGLCRHAGVHAAGVIVADVPLETVVPLYRQADSDDMITQWDGPTCEKVGLMKMDFLGLRTLTIIQRARELVRERTGKDVDPEKLPLDDDEVYQLFREGHTDGVFQFESDGMKNVLRSMQPSQINDLIAANAMYRPGPMELIPAYCARKRGEEPVPSVHQLVDDILAETYGIMTYQEQVMLVLNHLGKLPLNRALTLIKAISKKKLKVIAAEKPNFIAGAGENGISANEAEELFALIEKFAGYGFNKSHSTRYAIVAYQTAYFKRHYPREFLAATLTFECGDTDKVVQYMAEARRMGIDVLPPDINTCGDAFAVDGDAVRFGLSAVKGVGHNAVEAIVAARKEVEGKFRDLYHFCEHVDLHAVNRSTIEALIKCGAFDALGASRAAMMAVVDKAIELGHKAADDRKSGQMSFFGESGLLGGATEQAGPSFPNIEPFSESQLLAMEKETLGFFVSSHPLVKYGREMAAMSYPEGAALGQLLSHDRFPHQSRVRVGCMVSGDPRLITTKNGKRMAICDIEDTSGKLSLVVFPSTFEECSELIVSEEKIVVTGSVDWIDQRDGQMRQIPQIIADEIILLDQAVRTLTARVEIEIPPASDKPFLEKLMTLLKSHGGNCSVYLKTRSTARPDCIATLAVGKEFCVSPSPELFDALEDVLGDQKYLKLFSNRVAPKKDNGRGSWKKRKPQGQQGVASEAVTRFN